MRVPIPWSCSSSAGERVTTPWMRFAWRCSASEETGYLAKLLAAAGNVRRGARGARSLLARAPCFDPL